MSKMKIFYSGVGGTRCCEPEEVLKKKGANIMLTYWKIVKKGYGRRFWRIVEAREAKK